MVREIYNGRLIDLRVEDVTLPNGKSVELELIRHIGAAAVVAVDDAGQVVLIKQYRHATGGFIWEIPAGVLDFPNEPPAVCAARELREEVGLVADELRRLGTIFTTPGFTDEQIHLFLARSFRQEVTAHEHDEVIEEIRRVPLAEALDMTHSGDIVDAKTIVALHLAAGVLGVAE